MLASPSRIAASAEALPQSWTDVNEKSQQQLAKLGTDFDRSEGERERGGVTRVAKQIRISCPRLRQERKEKKRNSRCAAVTAASSCTFP